MDVVTAVAFAAACQPHYCTATVAGIAMAGWKDPMQTRAYRAAWESHPRSARAAPRRSGSCQSLETFGLGSSIVAMFYPFSQFCEINVSLLSTQEEPNAAPNLFQRGVEYGKYEPSSVTRCGERIHKTSNTTVNVDNDDSNSDHSNDNRA